MPDFVTTLRESMRYSAEDVTRPIVTLTHKQAEAILRVVEAAKRMTPRNPNSVNAVREALAALDAGKEA